MPEMSVTCPSGVSCGADMVVSTSQGQQFMVKVPAGIGPGDTFQIQIPEGAPPPPTQMMVTVTPGLKPGDSVCITAPSGVMMQVVVPVGVNEGGQFQVSVPVAAAPVAVAAPVAPVATTPVVAVSTGGTLTRAGGLPVQPGEGVPPGAPTGGEWMTVKYWGVKTWALQLIFMGVGLVLPIYFVALGMIAMVGCVFWLAGTFFFTVFTACGACVDMRLDKRTVYSIDGVDCHGHSKQQYYGTGRPVMTDCCCNMNCNEMWAGA